MPPPQALGESSSRRGWGGPAQSLSRYGFAVQDAPRDIRSLPLDRTLIRGPSFVFKIRSLVRANNRAMEETP